MKKKYLKYIVSIRFNEKDYEQVLRQATQEHLFPSTYIRKLVLETLNKKKK